MSEYEMLLIFEQFSMEYVEKSWEWLNDSEIRQLTDTLVFTKEDQLVWYESLPTKKDYRVWGISITGEKIGVVGLKKITKDSAEFFTYIGEKKYWGKGLGVQILSFAEEQARKLKLVKMILKVLNGNLRALNLYKRYGFLNEKQDDRYTYMVMMLPPLFI